MKNKAEIIKYLFFGVLATVVNILCYQFFGLILGEQAYLITNILSWIITVAFAYFTNKLWVFESKSWKFDVIKPEIFSFMLARVFSLVLEEVGLFLLIDILSFKNIGLSALGYTLTGTLIAKIIMQVIVVVSNYIFSKFFIFKNSKL